jgi:hypothetical protein
MKYLILLLFAVGCAEPVPAPTIPQSVIDELSRVKEQKGSLAAQILYLKEVQRIIRDAQKRGQKCADRNQIDSIFYYNGKIAAAKEINKLNIP